MDFLWDKITEWLKEMLVSGVISNLTGLFDATNQKVGEIAGQVAMTPQAWNASIFGMIQNLSKAYDFQKKKIVPAEAKDIRVEKYVDELFELELLDGSSVKCTPQHKFMDRQGRFIEAKALRPGQLLSGDHMVVHVTRHKLMQKIPVYDMAVPNHMNFVLANGLIAHNSGKSFSAKREISNAFLVTNDDILICDPESEYAPLVERLGGQVIRISPTSPDHINPMDINLNYSDDDILFEWLNNNRNRDDIFQDKSEQIVLWSIECQLEKILSEPHSEYYLNALAAAKNHIKKPYCEIFDK